ncbi:MAG: hypothetical protein K0R12_1304 [Gammaproteobacteria bacterium]|jgi:hypothetical protein|nr:hypothetical protein [Gammaproteobacteria bacterium]
MAYYFLSIAQKRALSALLARREGGHGQFGRVLMRKPYREDDDEGGSGLPSPFEQHPLLRDQPIGASSDLTAIIGDRNQQEMIDEAANRSEHDLSLELQQKPQLQAVLVNNSVPKLTRR